jgi:hypothetical protein
MSTLSFVNEYLQNKRGKVGLEEYYKIVLRGF